MIKSAVRRRGSCASLLVESSALLWLRLKCGTATCSAVVKVHMVGELHNCSD
jgi:hypothetical protein